MVTNGTVGIRPIKVGQAAGRNTVIESGLAAGDTVVTDGQMLLGPGAPVRVVKTAAALTTRRGHCEHPGLLHRPPHHHYAGDFGHPSVWLGGLSALPVSDLPNVDYPTMQVSAALPGASPETMASAVATPLERQFSTIAGIDSMTSTSTLGSTCITMQFALNRNIDAAAQDVQAAISQGAGATAAEHADAAHLIRRSIRRISRLSTSR